MIQSEGLVVSEFSLMHCIDFGIKSDIDVSVSFKFH